MDYIALVSRILHVLAAILLLGGGMFKLLVILPSVSELPEEERNSLKERFLKRWRYLVATGIALLIFSGFYNYLAVELPDHKGDGRYHMLMGIKILLAFVVFFLASALAGRSAALEFIRKKSKFYLCLTVTLATIVVVIAGILKVRGTV